MARVKVAGIFNVEQAVSAAETFALLYRPFTALYWKHSDDGGLPRDYRLHL
ncbi:hypothetical protein AWB72_01480 [Caballeronia concitans]|uniref:Uncharacterized protein n=1 Tax=Caballeronia concitans TaxID=1777133 RepID=A0A658QTX0_9BURK|nr:hypothetical protein BurMR1_0138 [Burkholderia sp. MR1]SAL21557.1 hypothetical protein AWB72_01480 [Caballeronia concitans]